jgi:hypothetical protein
MSHTEYSAQFVQYSSVFLGLEEAPKLLVNCGIAYEIPKAFQDQTDSKNPIFPVVLVPQHLDTFGDLLHNY